MTQKTYDPEVINQFVAGMYQKSKLTTYMYTAIGAFAGGGFAYSLFKSLIMGIGGSVAGGFAGNQYAKLVANKMQADAHLALCQVNIEKNTHPK